MIQKLEHVFEERFGKASIKVQSPGRINLIGEHTDYNDGFVLPASVDLGTYFVCAPNDVNKFRFFSYNLDDKYETHVDKLERSNKGWANFLLGVIAQFINAGKKVHGFDCVFGGNIPMGAGLSSSASIETGLAYAINQMEQFNYSLINLVKFSQKAEHEYSGVQCGIIDQFAVMFGRDDQVIKLDTRNLNVKYYPFEQRNHMLALVNTGVKHELAGSEYNVRRRECENGVAMLQEHDPTIQSLRDASLEIIEKFKEELLPVIYKRCRYVIEENMRVEKACEALTKNDPDTFGQQMYASHEGLKNLYEVSSDELNTLVELAKQVKGVKGARMMGGGFGGCTINLIKKEAFGRFEETINKNYKTPEGNPPQIIKINISKGTHIVND